MTETHPHHGRIPTGPVNLAAACLILAALVACRLTPDQAQHLETVVGLATLFLAAAQQVGQRP